MSTNLAMLDKLGLILASLMGIAVFLTGGFEFFVIFLVFLIMSVAITKYGYEKKRGIGIYEHERSWENVLANGTIPLICAIASPLIGVGAYIGSVAAIMSDKFASELGVLGPAPKCILTLKEAKRGDSGCISLLGTVVSFSGAILIGVVAHILMPETIGAWKIVYIGLIGFLGSFADSLAGVLEQRGIGTKETTNIICALVGAILGWAIII